jgi:plastocyanin
VTGVRGSTRCTIALSFVVCAALLIAGCGGSSAKSAKLSRSQLHARVSAAHAYAADAGGAARGPHTVQIKLSQSRVTPSVAHAKTGEVVVWTNLSPTARRIIAKGVAVFRSNALVRNSTYTFRVTTPGTIRYVTTPDTKADGTIVVTR